MYFGVGQKQEINFGGGISSTDISFFNQNSVKEIDEDQMGTLDEQASCQECIERV